MAGSVLLQRFYASKAWRELRERLIIERGARCERCGRDCSMEMAKLIGHHKVKLTEDTLNNPAVALNPENIEILCHDCHDAEHGEGFCPRRVWLVYGPPGSGRHEYVRRQAIPGDVIVDMRALWESVSGLDDQYPDGCKAAVYAARDALYDAIRTRSGRWQNAWVISELPRKEERERLALRLGAQVVLMDATEEECFAHAPERDHERIREWFREHRA